MVKVLCMKSCISVFVRVDKNAGLELTKESVCCRVLFYACGFYHFGEMNSSLRNGKAAKTF